MNKNISDEELLATINRLERYAELTDSRFRIPFTKVHFGIDSIIGLIPIAGETIGLVLSFYLILEAFKLGVPNALKFKMLRNVLLDWVIGLVPIAGDIADVAFKANIRNMKLLVEHIDQERQSGKTTLELAGTSNRSRLIFFLLTVLLLSLSIYLMTVTVLS